MKGWLVAEEKVDGGWWKVGDWEGGGRLWLMNGWMVVDELMAYEKVYYWWRMNDGLIKIVAGADKREAEWLEYERPWSNWWKGGVWKAVK
jgi:hypothetical protein